ncbi:MAG: YebC/PmpR family DNA-binding transcriptional regulator [Elusimicrobia bacterium]|nr:YebC/PmpR family DNA-binding transcriptional regulator [Elusimicrobiota bacterium]
MSGHSKWATIKHKKGATDAKRGAAFTKIIKEMTVAARIGGGDPGMNPRLRTVIEKAKAVNMPADNIKRAIQKGTGELPGQIIEEVVFEGYGPGGVAVMVETATDNRNRTVGDVRHIFDKYGGNLGQNGCVAWMFDKKGVIEIDADKADEDALMELVLEAGADDMKLVEGTYEVTTSPAAFYAVKQAIDAKGIPVSLAEVSMIPQTTVRLEGKQATQMLKLMDMLEEHDDVQNVSANFDIDASVMEQAS